MTSLLLDTNRYSDLMRHDPQVVRAVSTATRVWLPFIVVAELRAAFEQGSKHAENEQRLANFLAQPGVGVQFADAGTIEAFVAVQVQVRRQGTPIPQHDMWIAALALQHDLALYSRDSHFDHLPQLRRL